MQAAGRCAANMAPGLTQDNGIPTMSKADTDNITPPSGGASTNPSRRGLLAGSTAAFVVGAVALTGAAQAGAAPLQAEGDDAVLIALCGRQKAAWTMVQAIQNEKCTAGVVVGITPWSVAHEQRHADADGRYLRLTNEIAEIPPTTHAGLCAKAQAMRSVLANVVAPDIGASSLRHIASAEGGRTEHRLTLSLTRDVLAIVGRASA